MAKKSELFRQGNAIRGDVKIAGRQSNPLPATLYLIRLRAVPLKIAIPDRSKPSPEITFEVEVQAATQEEAKSDKSA